MRRPVLLFLSVLMLLVPSAAMAQSAGDEQYADPFGEAEDQSGSKEEPAPAPEPAPAAPAPAEPTVAGEEAVSAQEAAPTLPATGLPAGLLAGTGTALFAAGATLRRRAL